MDFFKNKPYRVCVTSIEADARVFGDTRCRFKAVAMVMAKWARADYPVAHVNVYKDGVPEPIFTPTKVYDPYYY